MARILLLFSVFVGVSACNTSQPIVPPLTADELSEVHEVADETPELPVIPPLTADELSEVYEVVDEMPELIGGIDALGALVQRLVISRACRNANGKMILHFIVDENGNVREPTIHQGIDGRCDAEAIRLVAKHAKFTPGRQDGRAVKVRMAFPITVR